MKKVLLVEDHLPTAYEMSRMLRRDGHDCLHVTSTISALEMAEMGGFDVLLTSLDLPERRDQPDKIHPLAGFRLAENVSGVIPGIKVVFYTSKDIRSIQTMFPTGLGRVSFLRQPIGFRELQAALDPRKKAAVVALADEAHEAEAIREMQKRGYTVYVPFEDQPDCVAAEFIRRQLVEQFEEVVIVC